LVKLIVFSPNIYQWGPLGQKGDIVYPWLSSKGPHSQNNRKGISRQYVIILDGFCRSGRDMEALSTKWFVFCIPQEQTPPRHMLPQKPVDECLHAVKSAVNVVLKGM
jgi:hypothetical protein